MYHVQRQDLNNWEECRHPPPAMKFNEWNFLSFLSLFEDHLYEKSAQWELGWSSKLCSLFENSEMMMVVIKLLNIF